MLNNITLGQYYHADSQIHKLDPRIKIILTLIFLVWIFLVHNFIGYGFIIIYLLIVMELSGLPLKLHIRSIRPLRFILIFTFIINLFFTSTGNALLEWSFIKITDEGLWRSVFMAFRLALLVMGASIMTLTTSPIDLTDGLERLLSPLRVIKFPAHELAMMMTIALRFIPTLLEETSKIMKAQMARGADFESGRLFQRAKAMVPVLVPLFISAFRHADELAMAMESRCYHGGEGRTRMKILKLHMRDAIAVVSMAVLGALVIVFG